MALQNLINVGVTAADVVMLGRVGETARSGSSLAGQVQYIMTLFLFGLTSGATVLTAQYWGKKDLRTIEKILGLGMRAAVFVTALFFLAAQIMPEQLLRIFTIEPEVIKEGVKYLRIVSFSYIFMGITQTYLYIMRSVERVVVATVVYLCSLLCNITINAILIFGLLGMPAMGVQGAAIGTLVSRILEMVLVCVYSKVWNKDIKFRIIYFFPGDLKRGALGTWNCDQYGSAWSYGKCCGCGEFGRTGGQTARNSGSIRTFQCDSNLSGQNHWREKV